MVPTFHLHYLGNRVKYGNLEVRYTIQQLLSTTELFFIMFRIIKKLFLSFTQFSILLSYRRSFTVLSTDVCVLISYYFSFLISVSKKWNIEAMLTLPYSYKSKSSTTKWMKKEASSIRVWTLNMLLGKLVVVFRSLSSDDFVDFCTVSKILICFSLIKRFANNHKRYSSHLQVLILHRVAHIKVYLTIYESLKNSYLKNVFVP